MTDYFVDYSTMRGLDIAINNGDPFHADITLLGLVSGGAGKRDPATGKPYPLPRSHDRVFVEINFEPHDPRAHDAVIDMAESKAIELGCVSLRASLMSRIADVRDGAKAGEKPSKAAKRALMKSELDQLGIKIWANNDFNAVESIRATVRSGRQVKRPTRIGNEQLSDWELFNRLRTGRGKASEIGQKFFRGKLEQYLPSYREFLIEHPRARCLGGEPPKTNRGDQYRAYSDTLVVAMILEAEAADDREAFDRRMGLYEHGYPSIRRAMVVNRAQKMARTKISYSIRMARNKDEDDALTSALRDLRWASRLIYSIVKRRQTGNFDPEMGKCDPSVDALRPAA